MNLAEERHSAALKILQAERSFVLLLRTYAKTMPWRRNLQNEVCDNLPPHLVALSIRGDHPFADFEESQSDPELRARCPALSIESADWQSIVRKLVDRATFLICEVWSDTPGVSVELTMCRNARRIDETVVLIPRPGVDELSCYDTFDTFWRLVLFDDLERCSLFSHPCARSLVSSVKSKGPDDDDMRSRHGIPFIIPELASLAQRYISDRNDWGSAAVHAQNAWNIGVRLATVDAPFTLAERDGLIRAAYLLAIRLAQFNRRSDALAKLDVALLLCAEPELQYHVPQLQQLKNHLHNTYGLA